MAVLRVIVLIYLIGWFVTICMNWYLENHPDQAYDIDNCVFDDDEHLDRENLSVLTIVLCSATWPVSTLVLLIVVLHKNRKK